MFFLYKIYISFKFKFFYLKKIIESFEIIKSEIFEIVIDVENVPSTFSEVKNLAELR